MSNNTKKNLTESNYTAKNIVVSLFPKCVQDSPGMYIGNVNGNEQGDGINHMVIEIVSNSVDECMAGYANKITVTLKKDGFVEVEDNGRGMPPDELSYADESGNLIKKTGIETIFTVLHAGAKSTGADNGYKVSGGRHGVGASVVNALSDELIVKVFRDYEYTMTFKNGLKVTDLEKGEKTDKTGTFVSFKPSPSIFTIPIVNHNVIEQNLEELSFLNSNIKINFNNEYKNENKIFYSPNGLLDFMKKLLDKKKTIIEPILLSQKATSEDTFECDIGMVWCNEYEDEECYAYTNNIHQPDYGYHVTGFRFGLMRGITNYIDKNKNKDYISNFFKKHKDIEITSEDVRGGMKNIINVKCSRPMFSSQTKTKLVSVEVKAKVEKLMEDKFRDYLEKNPEITKKVLNKIFANALARTVAKKEREKDFIINDVDSFSIPGKLADCDKRIPPAERELIMVEGNSAAGTAKQARGLFQAILAMKGKPTNAMKIDKLKVLATEAFTIILGVLGVTFKDFEDDEISYLEKLRYHKIILMADADVDGSHIRALVLTFFYKYLPLLIKNGHVYVALPPLYGVKFAGKITYIKDEDAFKTFLATKFYEDYSFESLKKSHILSIEDISNLVLLCEEYKNKLQPLWKGDIDLNIYSYLIILLFKCENFQEVQYNLNNKYPTMELFDNGNEYLIKEATVYGTNSYYITKILPDIGSSILSLLPLKITPKKNQKLGIKTFENPLEILKYIKDIINRLDIQRFKGLGEMNADQLEETAINPNTRNIVQITLEDEDIYTTSKIIDDLMTHEGVDIRKQIIIDGINKNLLIDV